MKPTIKTTSILILALVSLSLCDTFKAFWYDGKAEISVYSLTEKRYGEYREGTRVMVFVTEPMRLSTHIKPDESLSGHEKIEVIKLNDIRKFTTGIYDYSAMTSVFSAVERKNTIPLFGTMKLSFTSQEWCGNVFEQLKRKEKVFEGRLHSYFETEGESEYTIDCTERVEAEENLWLLIRELQGPILSIGQTMHLQIIPSAWSRRKTHTPVKSVAGILRKIRKEKVQTGIGTMRAVLFSWEYSGKSTTVWIEQSYPHRILSWKEWDGTKGKIIASRRETYWKQNRNKDIYLREKLKLDKYKKEGIAEQIGTRAFIETFSFAR